VSRVEYVLHCTLGVCGAAVTTHDLYTGVRDSPPSNRCDLTILKHIDDAVLFEVDENGTRGAGASKWEVVDAEHPWRIRWRDGQRSNRAQ
jgi:hypothetical protein